MALLERVTTLVRANLNDLVDKAEDPEKLLKQVILDMQNQLMQVKTQVAMALADQHLLEKKQHECEEKATEWERKADLAVTKKQDDLARAALDRALGYQELIAGFKEQLGDQRTQVENLKVALRKLQQKLEEAEARFELLMAQHRRSRISARGHGNMGADDRNTAAFARMRNRVARAEAISSARTELLADNLDDRLDRLEKDDRIEQLLAQIKLRKGLPA